MLDLQRWSRTDPFVRCSGRILASSGTPSMFLPGIRGMGFASGSEDTASLLQSSFSSTPIHKAILVDHPPSLNIQTNIYLRSTNWYFQVLPLFLLFYFFSPRFSFFLITSLPLRLFFHPAIHFFTHVFIIFYIFFAL